MPKLFLLIGVILLLFGFQLWDNGLYSVRLEYPEAVVCTYADKGESVSFAGDLSDAYTIAEMYAAKIWETEDLDDGAFTITVLYARSSYLTGGQTVNGRFVNLQIAFNERTGVVTVGTPLILGSY